MRGEGVTDPDLRWGVGGFCELLLFDVVGGSGLVIGPGSCIMLLRGSGEKRGKEGRREEERYIK